MDNIVVTVRGREIGRDGRWDRGDKLGWGKNKIKRKYISKNKK